MSVRPSLWLRAPGWGRTSALALALMCALVVPAAGQPKGKNGGDKAAPAGDGRGDKSDRSDKADKKKADKDKIKNFDMTGFDLNGRMRTPQLLYFLERATEELERATLEKRSFIPDMVRSIDDEGL